MILVYHAKPELRLEAMFYGTSVVFDTRAALREFDNEGYVLVANVYSDDLDFAWTHTNHTDYDWTTHGSLILDHKFDEVRSTSIGDILVAPDGVYIAAPVGFDLLRKFDS